MPILLGLMGYFKAKKKKVYPNSSNSNSHSNKEDRLMSFSKNTDERRDEDAWPKANSQPTGSSLQTQD